VIKFQILIDLSLLQLASLEPSGLKQTPRTKPECPLSVDWHSKVPAEPTAHILTVLSQLPDASLVPSLFHATDMTSRKCSVSIDSHLPVVEFQSLIVLSLLPLAILVPSGLHATEQTLRLRWDESAHEAA
jgi:hypothetical protein